MLVNDSKEKEESCLSLLFVDDFSKKSLVLQQFRGSYSFLILASVFFMPFFKSCIPFLLSSLYPFVEIPCTIS